jgi:hypothetical protein
MVRTSVRMALGLPLVLLAVIYATGVVGNPLVFSISFFVAFCVLLSWVFALVTTNVILRLSAANVRRRYETDKRRFKAVILAYPLLFLLGGSVINHYWLPDLFSRRSLLTNVGLLALAVFLGWSLIRSGKKRTLFIGVAVLILFVFGIIYVDLGSPQHSRASTVGALRSLPYTAWGPPEESIEESGVVRYEQERCFEGVNIYNPANLSTAYLVDMFGNTLHTWSAQVGEDDAWNQIEMDENGDLLCIVKDKMVIRLDWDSNIKWIRRLRCHHDIAIDETKDIYVVCREDEVVFSHGLPLPILNDYIVVLSEDGEAKKRISFFKILDREIPLSDIIKIYSMLISPVKLTQAIKQRVETGYMLRGVTFFDVFHNNNVEVLDRNIEGLCKKGDILLSARELDLICILDMESEKVAWRWGPVHLSRQHHPSLLENGNILVFDNGVGKRCSRVIELDPHSREIVWEYKAKQPEQFYSPIMGASQRLPNGNTLITDSIKGYVFEVTQEGRIVWEFYNPELGRNGKRRATLHRMTRIVDQDKHTCLEGLKPTM